MNEDPDSNMVKIGDIVYLELGSVHDYYVQTDGFMNDKIIVDDFSRSEKKMDFNRCLFRVLPGDKHNHKTAVHKLISRVTFNHLYLAKYMMKIYQFKNLRCI